MKIDTSSLAGTEREVSEVDEKTQAAIDAHLARRQMDFETEL